MIKSHKLVEEYRKQIGHFTYLQLDCIKSIANILYKYGGSSELTGSNWFARHEIINMRPLTNKSQLYDGCAVLKTLLPGQSGYDLPDIYINDVILVDYNHIGLGTDVGEILDSTRTADGRNGPDISRAPIGPNSWDIIGDFEDVDYSDRWIVDEGGIILDVHARVIADTGTNVNLRSRPSINSVVVEYVKVGEEVDVLDQVGAWWKIRTLKGNLGWMMPAFLEILTAEIPPVVVPGTQPTTGYLLSPEQRELLREAIEHIQSVIGNG